MKYMPYTPKIEPHNMNRNNLSALVYVFNPRVGEAETTRSWDTLVLQSSLVEVPGQYDLVSTNRQNLNNDTQECSLDLIHLHMYLYADCTNV